MCVYIISLVCYRGVPLPVAPRLYAVSTVSFIGLFSSHVVRISPAYGHYQGNTSQVSLPPTYPEHKIFPAYSQTILLNKLRTGHIMGSMVAKH